MRLRLRPLAFCLASIAACSWSTIRIPEGMSRDQVHTAVRRALDAEGYRDSTVRTAPAATATVPDMVANTGAHYCVRCGVWNAIWGVPLYWYRHEVATYDTRVRVTNRGYVWNIWIGFVSLLVPVYDSGGLSGRIRVELERAAAESRKGGGVR